ncbi:MAG: hypothetical protein QOF21_240, partial [Actinomycetota bacterium]
MQINLDTRSLFVVIAIGASIRFRRNLGELGQALADRLWRPLAVRILSRFDGEIAYRFLARNYCRSILADDSV